MTPMEWPREMDLCLSNECNLDCGYCYVRGKKRSSPDWLGAARVEKAVELYRRHAGASRIQKVSISGGEPFLRFDLLLAAVRTVRDRLGARPRIEVFTNGTLITPGRVRALLEHSVDLVVSFDGPRAVQDRNRRFWGDPQRSTYSAVLENIKRLGPGLRGELSAGATFDRDTMAAMGPSTLFLLALGFKCVIVDLDILAEWERRDLPRLRASVQELKRLHVGSIQDGFGDAPSRIRFDFIIPRVELGQVARPPGLREIALGPDGFFYPSGLVAAFGPGNERYRIGDPDSGFDTERMAGILAEARAYFCAHPRKGYNGCPMHVYFHCRLRGEDPERIFAGGERLYLALEDVVGPVIDFELLMHRLCSDKEIGDFGHLPREVPGRSVRRLELKVGSGLGPARDAADRLLYSPGDEKTLALRSGDLGREFADVEALTVYCMMKARHLGKRVRIGVAVPRRTVGARHRLFMREHGIAVGEPRGFSGLFSGRGGR